MEDDFNSTPGTDTNIPVAPGKPVLVYDGDCTFCKYWVNRWKRLTNDEVHYVSFQELPPVYLGVSREQFRKAVYLITKYRTLHGAEAIFELMTIAGDPTWVRLYHIPLANHLFELGYRTVANNRDLFYKLLKPFMKSA